MGLVFGANSAPPRFRVSGEPHEGPDREERKAGNPQRRHRERGQWGESGDAEDGCAEPP